MNEIIRVSINKDGKMLTFGTDDFLLLLACTFLGFILIPVAYFVTIVQTKLIPKREYYENQIKYFQKKLKEEVRKR